jgi:hypothetical protein
MTNLVDTLVDADGALAEGQVTLYWPMFMSGGSAITQGQKTYEIENGQINLSLYPTVTAQPNGSYYTATFELMNGSVYDEYWLVPDQANPVKLNQVRAMFPPSPGIFINSLQITGGGASVGQFLGWNGNQWVPMSVTTVNISPNTISLDVTSNPAADISVPIPAAALGAGLTLNIPDAAASSRGVVTTGAQTFGGVKTFANGASFPAQTGLGAITVFPSAPAAPIPWGAVWFDPATDIFHFVGSFSFQTPTGGQDLPNPFVLGAVSATHVGLAASLSPAVSNPSGVTMPGAEAILLPTGSYAHGIGVDVNDWTWVSSGQAFAALRPDAAWVANWIDLSPYQHPIAAGSEASPSQSSIALYRDSSQWIGMGVDNSLRLWFRVGPTSGGTYYRLDSSGSSLQTPWASNVDATGHELLNVKFVGIGSSTFGSSPLNIQGLPTSAAGLSPGDVWNNGGVLKIA